MSTPGATTGDGHRYLYWILGAIVVVLTIIGLVTYDAKAETREAEQKAQELSQKLEQAGMPVPDQDILVRSLGDDGAAICDDPGSGLRRAIAHDMLTNGASQVGRRPVIADNRVVEAQLLVIETYCPDELEDFREKFEDLKTDDVIRN